MSQAAVSRKLTGKLAMVTGAAAIPKTQAPVPGDSLCQPAAAPRHTTFLRLFPRARRLMLSAIVP